MANITKEQARAELARRKKLRESQNKGFSGIGADVEKSLSSLPQAAGELISSIPEGAENVFNYASTTNPLSTLANLGAGGVESGTALLSSPQKLMRYLADKFPQVKDFAEKAKTPGVGGIDSPTLYEGLTKFEQEHGLEPQSEEESSVRSAGGLMFGGKALSNLSNMLTRSAALASENAGRGGDPVHAAILGMLGETVGKVGTKGINKAAGQQPSAGLMSPPAGSSDLTARIGQMLTSPDYKTAITNIPSAATNLAKGIPQAISKLPELAGSGTASVLEGTADYASKIPVVGGAAQPTIGAIASYLKHISVPPEELAKRNLFGDIKAKDIPAMMERDAAAKRLGLAYVTPSELLNSPFESVKQANVGRTTEGSKLLFEKGESREASEEAAINKLTSLIHEDKLDPVKNAAYKETMQSEVPQEFIQRQIQKPVIQKAMNMVKNNTAFKQLLQDEYGVNFDKVPANSFMFWDMVKRALYEIESKSGKKGAKTEPAVYSNIRKEMVREMDKIQPQYKVARNIAEREFTKAEIEKVFDKKAKTFNNFDSYLKSKEKYDKLMQKLEPFPEAQQQLKDIKTFSGKLIPNNPTVRAAAALKRTGMTDARNALEAKKRALDEKYGQEHDVAGVNLMTSPNLMSELTKYLQEKGKL